MEQTEKKNQIFHMLAKELRIFLKRGEYDLSKIQEIRLRQGRPLLVVYHEREYYVEKNGRFVKEMDNPVIVTARHIQESLEYISNYSMYAFEEEIRQGYVTVAGGHRVGIAGKVIWERGKSKSIRHISFLNIRLAHEVRGCAIPLLSNLYENGRLLHTLIISPPGCGKTTLLRDIIRLVSEGNEWNRGMTVGVVDERSEIAACYQGIPQNDIGCRTDVLDGCPKSEGMLMLVRSMAPEVIAVDELGTKDDAEAIGYIMRSGVSLLATAHGYSVEQIRQKPVFRNLIQQGGFERRIVLKEGTVGQVKEISDGHGRLLFTDA